MAAKTIAWLDILLLHNYRYLTRITRKHFWVSHAFSKDVM